MIWNEGNFFPGVTQLIKITIFIIRRCHVTPSYLNILERARSAFFLWMNSIRTRLFLNTLPLHFMYNWWYLQAREMEYTVTSLI